MFLANKDLFIHHLLVLLIVISGYIYLWVNRRYSYFTLSLAASMLTLLYWLYPFHLIDFALAWQLFVDFNAFFVIVSLLGAVGMAYFRR